MNGFLLSVVIVGWISLVIGIVNRLHGAPLPYGILHRIRQGHDLVLVAIPCLIVWFAGIRGPGLLFGGSWRSVSLEWQVVFVAGYAGTALLLVRSIRRMLRRAPSAVIAETSRTLDVACELGKRPVGHGPYEFMLRIPGNQAFQIEVAERHFRLPRLPAAWDGMTILHLSDFHYIGTIGLPYFEYAMELSRELKPDLIVFSGDLMDNEKLRSWIPPTLGTLSAELGCYFILGNHDWYLDPDETRRVMCDTGWTDVASQFLVRNFRGHSLLIAGTEYPWMGHHPELAHAPQADFRLLVSHTPDNMHWARRHGVDLMLSGHNHGGQVRLPLLGPIYSPSIYGCYYSDGTFWESPTLLHVSRGLAGRHPWRWNCPPEITKLVLHPEREPAT